MDFEIKNLSELFVSPECPYTTRDDGFRQAVEDAIAERNSACNSIYSAQNGFVAISPKYEEKLLQNPELAEDISEKINGMGACRDSIIIVDRRGEITQYSAKNDKRDLEREIADAKEAAKARLRRKARLDAYFSTLERIMIKRKLVEQENAKRFTGKKFRTYGTMLEAIASSIHHKPTQPLQYQTR